MGKLEFLRRSVARRGCFGTLRYIFHELLFDHRYGTDTAAGSLVFKHGKGDDEYEAPYQGSNPWIVSRCLRQLSRLGVKEEASTLLDYGSGKGRVMVMALRSGFAKAIGVELDPSLCAIAEKNITRVLPRLTKSTWSIHQGNAVDYEIPPEVNVVFLYNPFSKKPLGEVLQKLVRSLQAAPRKLFVVYVNPVCADALDEFGFIQVSDVSGEARIYTFDAARVS